MRGKIIVIEGTDCSGKETQTRLLETRLKELAFLNKGLRISLYDEEEIKTVHFGDTKRNFAS